MANFSVPTFTANANVERDSASIQPGANFHSVTVQLTDPNSVWPATPDDTRHIVVWGFQTSSDNGQTWNWGPTHQREPAPGLPFGSRDRSGGLPAISMESSDVVVTPTTRLRLAILTDSTITLGASITVA